MKQNLSKQSATILSILLLSIALMLSCNAFAAKPVRVEMATKAQLDAAVPAYAIGDSLPDGGIVFYIEDFDGDGFGWHGLAAQPFNDANTIWYHAKETAELHGPGWRLPTKHELDLLYKQKHVVGNFRVPSEYDLTDYLWSSTEYDATNAWRQDFFDGDQYIIEKDGANLCGVRAVRTF